MSIHSPREEYPAPIGVLTSTLLGYDAEKPSRIVLVELQRPEVPGKPIVLPGGIFNLGLGRHRSQRTVIDDELLEETGLRVAPGALLEHIAISQRIDADPRQWCSFPTVNGANDYIMAAPLVGELRPQDEEEVKRAFFQDVSTIDRALVGRGHGLLLDLWQRISECGGLGTALYTEENQRRIEALSNERHRVSMSQLTNMIYLEDVTAVRDARV